MIPLPDGETAVALASLAIHAQELLSPHGSVEFDGGSILAILEYPGVQSYLKELDTLSLLPVMREPS